MWLSQFLRPIEVGCHLLEGATGREHGQSLWTTGTSWQRMKCLNHDLPGEIDSLQIGNWLAEAMDDLNQFLLEESESEAAEERRRNRSARSNIQWHDWNKAAPSAKGFESWKMDGNVVQLFRKAGSWWHCMATGRTSCKDRHPVAKSIYNMGQSRPWTTRRLWTSKQTDLSGHLGQFSWERHSSTQGKFPSTMPRSSSNRWHQMAILPACLRQASLHFLISLLILILMAVLIAN